MWDWFLACSPRAAVSRMQLAGRMRPARSFYAARWHLQKYKPCSLVLTVEMAWAAKRPANESLPIFEIPFNFHFSVKCGWTFIEEWALGRLGLFLGWVSVLVTATGQEVPGHGRSGLEKSQPVPSLRLYLADIEWNIRTFADVWEKIRTSADVRIVFSLHLI